MVITHIVQNFRGCYTQGDSYEEVIENIRDAIKLHIEDTIEKGEEIPQPEITSLTTLKISV